MITIYSGTEYSQSLTIIHFFKIKFSNVQNLIVKNIFICKGLHSVLMTMLLISLSM